MLSNGSPGFGAAWLRFRLLEDLTGGEGPTCKKSGRMGDVGIVRRGMIIGSFYGLGVRRLKGKRLI